LAALIVGLGVLSLGLMGHGADAHGADLHLGGGHGDLGHGHAGAHGADDASHHSSNLIGLALFLSLRFWSFASMAFGLVGMLLTWFALAGTIATAITAAAVGVFSGGLAATVFRALGSAAVSSGGETNEALGQVGRVLLPIERGHMGKIRVEVRGRLVDLVATTDGERLEGGTAVIVNHLEGATAKVSAAPAVLSTKVGER